MSEDASSAIAILNAVEDLTDLGSVGFYASAIAAESDRPVPEVSSALMALVEQTKLELSFELRCPDNGRRIAAYREAADIPLGREFSSDRCESDQSFIVDETDVFVRFKPSQSFAASVRRSRVRDPRDGDQGKVRRLRLRRRRAADRTQQ